MLEIRHATTRAVLLQIEGDTWEGRNLVGAALDDADLAKLRMSHSCLRKASLRRVNFSEATLQNASLDGANLERACLAGADLTSATLLAAVLVRADLRKAILRYATLTGASCEGANLQGADLSMADARANFRHASLIGCDLRGANLAGANLQNTDLTGADLTGANLAGAVLVGAKLQGAKMPPLNEARVPAALTAPPDHPSSAPSQRGRVPSGQAPSGRPKADADWIPTTGPDFNSVRVNCPECGFSTRLGTAQLEGSYRCRACQSVFKLDKAGKPQVGRAKGKKEPAPSWEPPREPSKAKSRIIQAGVLLAALGSMSLLVMLGIQGWQAISLPSELSERAIYVADAFVYQDTDRAAALVPAGMRPSIEQWQTHRPERWTELLRGSKPRLRVKDIKQGASSAVVLIEVAIAPRPIANSPATSTDTTAGTAILTLYWTHADNGQWLLDAVNTLKNAPTQY
jgi:uncharacterized protein YjbI with pentapeptide repeats